MKVTDDLFQLIKSLDKNEKRYFKLYAAFYGGEKKYVKLFDAIDQQKVYNEEYILQLFTGKESLKQISVAKNFLYYLILKSLCAYSRGKSFDSELREKLDYVEVLYKKGLYKHSFKEITKAKKMANTCEKHSLIPEILNWEVKMLSLNPNNHLNKTSQLIEETDDALNNLENTYNYLNLSLELWMLFGKIGKARSKEELNEFNKIFRNSLLQDESKAFTVEAKLSFCSAHVYYNRVKGDYKKAYIYCKKAIQHMELHPFFIQNNPNKYSAILGNFLYILAELKKYDEYFSVNKKFKGFIKRIQMLGYKGFSNKLIYNSYYAELLLYVYTGEFKQGLDLVKEIENEFKRSKNSINRYQMMFFYFEIAKMYFGAEEYKKSLEWINKALNEPEIKNDPHYFLKIFNLILHYELGNTDMFESMIKSIYRAWRKRKKLYKVETIILNGLKRLSSVSTQDELIQFFIKLKNQLLPYEKTAFEKLAFEEFDLISWLESKIENRPFAQVVKEKAKTVS